MKRIALISILCLLIFAQLWSVPLAYSQPIAQVQQRYELLNWVNVKESPFGAKGNGTTDDSIAFIAAIAKAGGKILYVPPGTYKLSNSVTSGSTVEVWFSNGVTLSVDNTKTFTISGKLHTPFIPTNSGLGTFTYSSASMPTISVAGALEWLTGNVTYVPLSGNIQTYVTNAVAGDTLILASGVYTITDTITINKQLNIVGQGSTGFVTTPVTVGHGTLISCATANKIAFNITSSNVRISDLSINMSGANSKAVSTANNLVGVVLRSVDIVISCTGVAEGFEIFGSNVIMRDLTFHLTSSDSYCVGVFAYNTSATLAASVIDCFNVTGVTIGAGGAALNYGMISQNNNVGFAVTLNLFDCVIRSISGSIDNSALVTTSTTTFNAVINAYHCTINGSTYDLKNATTNVLSVWGCTLVNGTTSGTITYSGSVVSSNIKASKVINGGVYPLTYAGTIACDMSLGNTFTTTTVHATGNATINATGGTAGQKVSFVVTNDATTAKTITFGTNFQAGNSIIGQVSTTKTADFVYDGSTWQRTGGGVSYISTPLVFADPLAVDMSVGNQFTFTATGNSTINATGGTAGQEVTFIITSDVTGGRVMTFNTNFDSKDTLILSASDQSIIKFAYDGTAWREICRSPESPVYIWK